MESWPGLKSGGLDLRKSLDSRISWTLLLWQKSSWSENLAFSVTKQDRVGPSLLSRNHFFYILQLAVHTVQRNWISRLGKYLMVLAYVGLCWPILSCDGLSWPVLAYSVLCWPIMSCAGLSWPVPAYSVLCWPKLACAGLPWWPLIVHPYSQAGIQGQGQGSGALMHSTKPVTLQCMAMQLSAAQCSAVKCSEVHWCAIQHCPYNSLMQGKDSCIVPHNSCHEHQSLYIWSIVWNSMKQ